MTKKSQGTEKSSATLITSSDNDHSHGIHLFSFDMEDVAMGGETSLSTGDAANDQLPHSHPWKMNEDGEIEIGEANGHSHSVDPMEVLRAMRRFTMEQMERSASAKEPEEFEPDSEPVNARKRKRILSNAQVGFVSLCRRGMNGIQTLMKSDGRFSLSSNLSKMSKEGLLHTLVWVPDLPCHEGDVMTKDEVRKMAHGFLPHGGKIDIEHDGAPLSSDQVSIAEHYIVPPGDPKFQGICTSEGTEIDPTDAWGLILKIHDPEIRADYDSGEWNGVSLAGRAEVMPVGKTKATNSPQTPTEEDFDMTPEEREKFGKDLAEQIVSGLSTVLKQNTEEASTAEPSEPVSKTPAVELPEDLDTNDPEQLEKWLDEIFVSKLDLSDPKDVQRLIKHRREQTEKAEEKRKADEALAKAEAEKVAKSEGSNEGSDGSESELEKAIRERDEANARIEKLEKASRQPAKTETPEEAPKVVGLEKSESEQWQVGLDLAKRMKERQSAVA